MAQSRLAGGTAEAQPGFFTDVATDYQVALLRCRDVTGDGRKEMIAAVGAGAARRIFSWAVFTSDGEGGWSLLFDRVGSQVDGITARGRTVIARTPAFQASDPLCCPSGFKSTRVVFRGGQADVVSAQSAVSEREIALEDGRVVHVGSLDAFSASPIQAVAELGAPTAIVDGEGSSCDYSWSDLGLSIVFANFGGGDSCGFEGRIASFDLVGLPAAQAGWQVTGGAKVGMAASTLRRRYPGAREEPGELVLVETPSVIGGGGTIGVMTAYLGDGKAWAFRFYVGAAGE